MHEKRSLTTAVSRLTDALPSRRGTAPEIASRLLPRCTCPARQRLDAPAQYVPGAPAAGTADTRSVLQERCASAFPDNRFHSLGRAVVRRIHCQERHVNRGRGLLKRLLNYRA